MWGCAPKAIITDQCLGMKNGIQKVFPDTRHRLCIWHIMKKVPEKFGMYNAYEQISSCMRKAVWNSLTIKQFEDAWDGFIKKYELQNNTWLQGLYHERKLWVPAYMNDCFWAGMLSTQRSQGMNAYFDSYIHSKTTLKQFVEQYENTLANKVESENEEDGKSWRSFIPLITKSGLEKQFQSVYTNEKVREFVGRLECSCCQKKESVPEYEVKEWITYGEEETRIQVPFIVDFNAETNEAHCNCRLFEYRGMVCRHQLTVWSQMGVERVPDKYVLRRWNKNVKRVHTKIRINYDNSSTSIEARRHDNMCNLFNEVADLAEDSQEKYDKVMARLLELKGELIESSIVCGSNVISGTPNNSISIGDGVLPSKESTNILDPVTLRRKGRPPSKRKIGIVEKIGKKKIETKKKTLSKEKAKSQPSYMGQSMWPNMMPHNMRPNMAQGGSIFQFSPGSCPTETGFNQFVYAFPSSQASMPTSFSSHDWRGQSNIASKQVWGRGQSNFLDTQGQCVGGPPPSFTQMLNAPDNAEE
ncbi:hypothetical protein RHMOL_Rhmol03G0058900 [Rhododendron molle]|uniref:Uncharacterized protein n=1 Tax=Rhododendron molle TaxID=49168 RepID=A0ACC0PDG1_RHOML|nr:hypothetical protein RHMOL_Rhmol03G0058900 [Rhododendron molle]